MRCFFCFEIPYGVRRELIEIQGKISQRLDNFQVVKPENLHITLKFLGNIDENLMHKISSVITPRVENYNNIRLSLEGLGVFPDVENARVLWVGVEDNKVLFEIYNTLDKILEKFGFTRESNFIPHVTLGRFKTSCNSKNLDDILSEYEFYTSKSFDLSEILLKDSMLTPLGAVHSTGKRFLISRDN